MFTEFVFDGRASSGGFVVGSRLHDLKAVAGRVTGLVCRKSNLHICKPVKI